MFGLLSLISIIVNAFANDFRWIPFGGYEYYISSEKVTYDDALSSCSKNNSQLVEIYTEKIQMFLSSTINGGGFSGIMNNISLQVIKEA